MHKVIACVKHDLRRLATTPRAWAVVILMVLFVENQFAPIRLMLVNEKMTIGFGGMAMYLLNDAQFTMMAGLGLLLLLFDAPFTDETQRYIITRTGRRTWSRAQVAYVLLMCVLYVILLLVILLAFQWPWTDWSDGWSSGLNALVKDGYYEYYDTMLDYDPWLMDVYSPLGGMGLMVVLHVLAFGVLALVQYLVNVLGGGRIGFLIASAPLLFDMVIEEFFGVEAYYFSPVTLARLATLDYGDEMGRPPIWYAFLVLTLLIVILSVVCVRLSKRKEIML